MRVRMRNPERLETVPGPATVAEVLERLEVNPTTVLVIHDGQLVTHGTELPDDSEIEIRPVISGGADARCFVCRAPAVIEEPRHRSAWCPTHFVDHVQSQIRKAIDQRFDGRRMFSYADRLLVAVSGGKDSMALWDALLDMGYRVDGLYVGLGIGGYSRRSEELVRAFARDRAEPRGGRLITVDLAEEYGYTTVSGSQATSRSTCGVCGLSKRYVFNKVAVDGGYDVMLTGHNLDDEAATLLGNLLRWHDDFLARQRPVLPGNGDNQVRKVKPLYRLSEREMAAYCLIRGIDYIVEECPLVDGNTGTEQKDVLNQLEAAAPGSKAQFLFGFLDRHDTHFASDEPTETLDDAELHACRTCRMPTTGDTCAFCRQRERILAVLPLAAPQTASTPETTPKVDA